MAKKDIKKENSSEKLRINRLLITHELQNAFFICAGISLAAFGLKGFLLPNGFLDGGVTGISLLINKLTGISFSLLILLINTPFIYVAYRQMSPQFAFRTALAIVGLAIMVNFLEMESLTHDKLLIAVFGGFFLGAGIGLAIRGGSVIDGTEVLAVSVSRNSFLSVGDFIAIFNVFLFGAAIFLTNLETALYSMLTYLAASKTVDYVITGIEEYIGVTIVSDKAEEIKEAVIKNLGMAVTVYKGKGGFGKKGLVEEDRQIIFTVITRLEVQKLKIEIEKVDPDAFVIQNTVNDTKGGMIRKRPFNKI